MTTTWSDPLVLFVDDHHDTRAMYSDFFVRNGFRTADAADGFEAIARAKSLHPDLMVLDIKMPRLDGIAVLRLIRARPELRDLPILVLTSFDFYETEALEAGATGMCVKPCVPDKLLREVRTLLSRSQKQ